MMKVILGDDGVGGFDGIGGGGDRAGAVIVAVEVMVDMVGVWRGWYVW